MKTLITVLLFAVALSAQGQKKDSLQAKIKSDSLIESDSTLALDDWQDAKLNTLDRQIVEAQRLQEALRLSQQTLFESIYNSRGLDPAKVKSITAYKHKQLTVKVEHPYKTDSPTPKSKGHGK